MTRSTLSLAVLVLAAACSPNTAAAAPQQNLSWDTHAAPSHGAALSDDPRVESFRVRGSSLERVRATVAVRASADRVRDVLFDFARYPEFMPHYTKATVARRPGGERTVRMELDELGGVVHLWMRIEIAPPVRTDGVESYDGRMTEGNVKAFHPRWEIESVGAGRTRLVVESFLDPDLALVPSSLINQGARDGIREAVLALKARAERGPVAAR